jgi:peptidyl-prolyl cis-trans isomerase NIMA-interacting 1
MRRQPKSDTLARVRRTLTDGAFLGIVVGWTALACGGAPARSATDKDALADKCLAIADGKHPHNPNEPPRITVKHILVRYMGAKRAPEGVTRTRPQACLRAREALAKMKEGMSFPEAVRLYSDESGAATREGSLGAIERNDVAPSFADAAFELQTGEVSEVVESPFGFHLILRVE